MGLTKKIPGVLACLCVLFQHPAAKAQHTLRPIVGPIRLSHPPDTLNFGNFTVVVDSFASKGVYDAKGLVYTGLSGKGTIHFGCQRPIIIFGNPLLTAKTQPVYVVDTVLDPARQLSVSQAAKMGLQLRAGEQLQLQTETPIKKLNNLGLRWPGVNVTFTGVTVHPVRAGYGTVSAGIATGGNFSLNVAPGFRLEVDTVTIRPGQNAEAGARLWLPASLGGPADCQGASIGLGTISLSNACEFYKVLPDSNYGVFTVGNTTLAIHGRGYVADFSTTLQYAADGHPAAWKGVDLLNGGSDGNPGDTVLSNTGYLQGRYLYPLAGVDAGGLSATMTLAQPYTYAPAQPLGYVVTFDTARLVLDSSQVFSGLMIGGHIRLPRTAARLLNDADVVLPRPLMAITRNLDAVGLVSVPQGITVCWGDFVHAGGGDQKSFGIGGIDSAAMVYFAAQPKPFHPPLSGGASIFDSVHYLSLRDVDSLGFQGVTFKAFTTLFVNTPQSPTHFDPQKPAVSLGGSHLDFGLYYQPSQWLNVASEGVACNIHTRIGRADSVFLGDPSQSLYDGVTPFTFLPVGEQNLAVGVKSVDAITLECWESAVVQCRYKSILKEAQPTGGLFVVDGIFFTSTANNAGGQVGIGLNDSLSYWGLALVQKPGFASGGTLSGRTGQIILTASGLSETRHFSQPFWLTWGEILANGSVGRLFFDYNSANQAFDKFDFVPTAIALSPYHPGSKPYLHVAGNAHFHFFGGDYLNILDSYVPAQMADPFDGREVSLSNAAAGDFLPTHRSIGGNWHDGLGLFQFNIDYNATSQDGFVGTGSSALRCLPGGSGVGSTLDMSSRGTCIRMGTDPTDMHAIALGPVADVSNLTQIWGCACVHGDDIDNVVVGGSISNAANLSAIIREGDYLSAILQITPSMQRLTLDGMCSLSLALSLDAEVNGHAQLTLNEAQGYIEGEVDGDISLGQGDVLSGNSLQAQGQLDWHLGTDYQSLQGQVALTIMSGVTLVGGTGTTLGSGFYIGHNAPKADAWVLMGTSPQYALNTAAMPDNLTGIYGYIHVQQGVNLYIVSGQYEVFLGLGAFMLTPQAAGALGALTSGVGLPYIVGNLGGSINGEILGGLVSAGAGFDLQIIGPYPFSFQGSVGLHACVLWVFCGSVSVTIGLNSAQGFYIN